MTGLARVFVRASVASVPAVLLATTVSAEGMPPAEQNALVQKYCAVCHTDKANNGGLSLEHYDAARVDPPLAAMLLSKLRNGAMGAAGLGIPDPPTREAWVGATVAQAAGAENWTITRADRPTSKARILSASLVREVQPRKVSKDAPIYRLNMTCDEASRQGEIQLTWSPEPQTNRAFSVSVDGEPGIAHTLAGQEKMGNGTTGTSGRASAILQTPLPTKSLSITDLFEGETVVFPVGNLDRRAWQDLAACFQRS